MLPGVKWTFDDDLKLIIHFVSVGIPRPASLMDVAYDSPGFLSHGLTIHQASPSLLHTEVEITTEMDWIIPPMWTPTENGLDDAIKVLSGGL